MHNITQFGSYYAINIFFHRYRRRHIDPTAAYQGSSWGLQVLQTPPTRVQAGVCWSCHGAIMMCKEGGEGGV